MLQEAPAKKGSARISFEEFRQEVLDDYRMAIASREASLIGRREVLTGKAKFGIFGDGKELAQIAAAKCMKPGDIRSGYYRDQTLMFATGMSDIEKFFAQLYANPDLENAELAVFVSRDCVSEDVFKRNFNSLLSASEVIEQLVPTDTVQAVQFASLFAKEYQ